MPAFKIILFVLAGLIITLFAVKNMDMVEVSFYDFKLNSHDVKVPLLVVILISFGLGFLLAWVEGFLQKLRLKAQLRRQEKTIQQLTGDIKALQAPPAPAANIEPKE